MASGRILVVLIATRPGHVVYERFYDTFSEAEKAEVRAAFDAVAAGRARDAPDDSEFVGRYRNGRILMIPSGDLLFFGMGTGEYTELAVAEVLRALIATFRDLFARGGDKGLTDAAVLANYPAAVLAVAEVLKEGLPEHLEPRGVAKAMELKLPVDTSGGGKGMSLKNIFS